MKKIFSCIMVTAALVLTPFLASAEQPCDFSDINTPSLEMPFTVTNVEVTGEWSNIRHNYYVTESYDKVVKYFTKLAEAKDKFGKYVVMGATPQTGQTMTQVVIAYRNEHMYLQITPNGAGALLSLEASPVSYLSGAYDAAIYGFTLPDGNESSPFIWTEE